MAEESGMDMPAHVETYDRVIGILKWVTGICIVLVAFVIWLIA